MPEDDYARIERCIRYLADHHAENPPLARLAREAGLSPFHFQRLFKRWAGVSPKRFAQYLTAQEAKRRLASSRSLLDAAFDSGLSSPGRLHDLMVSVEAMTPGEYKKGGLTLLYGEAPSPFGPCLVALAPRGLCGLSFLGKGGSRAALAELVRRWPGCRFKEDRVRARRTARRVFGPRRRGLRLVLKGTAFQLKVWEALLRLPEGAPVTYGRLAKRVGNAKASRAVGTAVGQNPIAYLIPCHRVLRETGALGGYRWGLDRKRAMLAREGLGKS